MTPSVSRLGRVDYTIAADVFWSTSARRISPQGSVRFRRYATLEEAVRFFVENKAEARHFPTIDTDMCRYFGDEIRALYEHVDFPERPI